MASMYLSRGTRASPRAKKDLLIERLCESLASRKRYRRGNKQLQGRIHSHDVVEEVNAFQDRVIKSGLLAKVALKRSQIKGLGRANDEKYDIGAFWSRLSSLLFIEVYSATLLRNFKRCPCKISPRFQWEGEVSYTKQAYFHPRATAYRQ